MLISDWSSDVVSSDLKKAQFGRRFLKLARMISKPAFSRLSMQLMAAVLFVSSAAITPFSVRAQEATPESLWPEKTYQEDEFMPTITVYNPPRSEERRVGKD